MEKLQPVGELFKKSIDMYWQKGWFFAKLMSIDILVFAVFVPLVLALFLSWHNVYLFAVLLLVTIIFLLAAALMVFWVHVSLVVAVKEIKNQLTLQQLLQKSWTYVGPYAWISLLFGLIMLGGLILLIVPGIIFAIWFVFSKYALIFEDKKGWPALQRSKQLVAGNWWSVFGRILLVYFLAVVISMIPFLGRLINLLVTIPFIAVYLYLIYEDLKRVAVAPLPTA